MKQKLVRLLTYITDLVNQELLLQNEYFAAENRILPARLPPRLRLSDLERTTLAEIGKRLGRKALDLHDKGLVKENWRGAAGHISIWALQLCFESPSIT